MPEPVLLGFDQVLAIHHRMIDEFGGDPHLRDRGLLESALAMPAATFDGVYLHEGIAAMAAAYLFHICRNHAFVDGNKRTALATAEMFVLLNGRQLSAGNEQLAEFTLQVAAGTLTKDQTIAFFRDHVTD